MRLYETLRVHPTARWTTLVVLTLALVLLVAHQSYKEDISDFLPLGDKYNEALHVYQQTANADRIVAIFQYRETADSNPDSLAAAVDSFTESLQRNDREQLVRDLMSQADLQQVLDLTDYVYDNIPYFLTDDDYRRCDSLLSQPGYVQQQLAADKQLLLFPVGGLLSQHLPHDPLNLYTPVVARLQEVQRGLRYEQYEGHLFSPDMSRAFVVMRSPFGSSETEQNGRLVQLLQQTAKGVTERYPKIDIHLLGGPIIAVGNAQQIKTDSMLSVTFAMLLIIGLLLFTFRRLWPLVLILISIAWGWLFAMGALAVVHDSVSVIVIGISSVILGIAINYPLHLIAHQQHTPDIRSVLKEIVMPLLVGNITTVGAFMALVPLKSAALRDLGLFSAFLLIGTIVFVLLYLPHLLGRQAAGVQHSNRLATISNYSLEQKPWLVAAVVIITIVLGYFSLDTQFDSDIRHINYMTAQQRADMDYFQQLVVQRQDSKPVYVVTTDTVADRALNTNLQLQTAMRELQTERLVTDTRGCSQFLVAQAEQQRRLARWQQFLKRHTEALTTEVTQAAVREGFADDSFAPFLQQLQQAYKPQPLSFFKPLWSTVFAANCIVDSLSHQYHVVSLLNTHAGQTGLVTTRIEEAISNLKPSEQCLSAYAFDVDSMNSSISNRLSDDFNYIGWACGLIVFCFLWFSLGSIELALLSFLPMAVSWLWILGIMALLHIHFNVVNIILATFIFGQGDDYTIFMTEGCQYEYAYRRKMLASYKSSIILSALIMLIGIGSLILAKHPALHSLAQITIVGMFSVVLMAYLFPPFIFHWLVYSKGCERFRPLTIRSLLCRHNGTEGDPFQLVADLYRYKGVEISTAVNKHLRQLRKRGYDTRINSRLQADTQNVLLINSGWGELPVLLALQYPQQHIVGVDADADKLCVAQGVATTRFDNLTLMSDVSDYLSDTTTSPDCQTLVILLNPTTEETIRYASLHPMIIEY